MQLSNEAKHGRWLMTVVWFIVLARAGAAGAIGPITQGGPKLYITPPEAPFVGVHGKDVDLDGAGTSPTTVTLTTEITGSVCVAFLSGEHSDMGTPSDNKGNSYTKRGPDADYGALWSGFGLEVWADDTSCAGGSSHTLSVTKSTPTQETSIAFIEIRNGTSMVTPVQSYNSAAGAGVLVDGPDITVTGPAVICGAASGDGDANTTDQDLTPSRGTLVESSFIPLTAYVPFAIACDTVESAGTYDIDWTPDFNQGMAKIIWAVQ